MLIQEMWRILRSFNNSFKYLKDFKVIGAILIIVGTALGGGILALPISNASAGFGLSSIYLILVWFIMTYCALLLLEINLLFPVGTNFLTMANSIFGRMGQIVVGFVYLFLLYTLLCAYIAGGSDIISAVCKIFGIEIPKKLGYILFTFILGGIVFTKMAKLDLVNRVFLITKFVLYLFIIGWSVQYINILNITEVNTTFSTNLFMVLLTSFGFAVVIPSLRIYLGDQAQKLRFVVMLGSIIPLLVYLIWDFIIMGIVSPSFLSTLLTSNESTSLLINKVEVILQNKYLAEILYSFAAICLTTSFLGISLGLSDFLADGFGFKKKGMHKWLLFALTFFPPLLVVLTFMKGFVIALSYAGMFCLLLHIILPLLMAKTLVWQRGQEAVKRVVLSNQVLFIILLFTLFVMIGEIKEIWF